MPQPYVHIELDKPRKLRFRHSDLADLELQSGKGVQELMTTTSFQGTRLLLSYGLRWSDAKMTPAKASDLVDVWIEKGGTIDGLAEVLFEALRLAGFMKRPDVVEGNTESEGNAPAEATRTETPTSAGTS